VCRHNEADPTPGGGVIWADLRRHAAAGNVPKEIQTIQMTMQSVSPGKAWGFIDEPLKAAAGALAQPRKVGHLKVAAQRQRPSWSIRTSSFS